MATVTPVDHDPFQGYYDRAQELAPPAPAMGSVSFAPQTVGDTHVSGPQPPKLSSAETAVMAAGMAPAFAAYSAMKGIGSTISDITSGALQNDTYADSPFSGQRTNSAVMQPETAARSLGAAGLLAGNAIAGPEEGSLGVMGGKLSPKAQEALDGLNKYYKKPVTTDDLEPWSPPALAKIDDMLGMKSYKPLYNHLGVIKELGAEHGSEWSGLAEEGLSPSKFDKLQDVVDSLNGYHSQGLPPTKATDLDEPPMDTTWKLKPYPVKEPDLTTPEAKAVQGSQWSKITPMENNFGAIKPIDDWTTYGGGEPVVDPEKAARISALGFNPSLPIYKGMSWHAAPGEGLGPTGGFADPALKPHERGIFGTGQSRIANMYADDGIGMAGVKFEDDDLYKYSAADEAAERGNVYVPPDTSPYNMVPTLARAHKAYEVNWPDYNKFGKNYTDSSMEQLIDHVRGLGGDMIAVKNIMDQGGVDTQYVGLNNSMYRAKHAAFNPADLGSPDLLKASGVPVLTPVDHDPFKDDRRGR